MRTASTSAASPHGRWTVLATAGIALAGFALELLAFWPGLMSTDSVEQFTQAAAGQYNDHHPPVMAWLWSWTNLVVAGPGGMLTFHLVLLWAGLWAVAEGARWRGARHAWLVPLVGLLPFIANLAGVIWKDVGMAYALLCAGGLLYASEGRDRRLRFAAVAAAIVLIGYATMVRANAPLATFALACYAVTIAAPRAGWPRSIAAGAVLLGILLSLQQVIERKVLDASPRHLSQLVMLFDLAGIGCRGAQVEIPSAFRAPGYDAGALCRAYDPDQVDTLFFFPSSPLQTSFDADAFGTLRRTWVGAIGDHPALYVAHRAYAFAGLLGLHRVPNHYRYLSQPAMQSNPWGFAFTPNAFSSALDACVDALARSGLFSGALWIVVALGLLAAIAVRRMRVPFETVLLVSGLMNALPYFFFSLAPNYRFLYWTVLATSVAAVLVLLRAAPPVRHGAGDTLPTAT